MGLHLPQSRDPRPLCTVDRTTAALFALLLGIGIHQFYMGNTKSGILHLLVTIGTCGMGSIISLIEGIIYLSMSDNDFYYTYILNKKDWF
ncbi:MAG: TM2 domain-containing protein [Thermoguttaceae bacterium]|nr:TM2 domain-containing protein [Thermoguttaceae bacterium]